MILRLTAFFCLLVFSHAALAAEPLVFRKKISGPREKEVIVFLERLSYLNEGLSWSIAAADLNGDGVDEWIVRQNLPGCIQSATCYHVIAGLKDGEPATLGDFAALKVGLSDETAYGIRKLFIYNDENNDFSYETYAWSPANGLFGPE